MMGPLIGGLQKTTNHRVVLPFYVYAAFGFLLGTVLLFLSTGSAGAHVFNPPVLALTHTMALAWGTMIIFGASHQLLPVLVEGKLDSDFLAYLTFGFTSIGIPCLIYGFYVFDLGWPAQLGAIFINIGVLCYLSNVVCSALKSKQRNVHAWYVITASLWLFTTTFFGLLLVLNFRMPIFPEDSVAYLSLHAHLGIAGWFALMVIGVGARLIPMFLISKYTNEKRLWLIFVLLNLALISFSVLYLFEVPAVWHYIPILMALSAIMLFLWHSYLAYKVRIRKRIDWQLKTSLISVLQMLLPFLALIIALVLLPQERIIEVAMLYGFCTFFGWLTAIILGMTFKTYPFIIWNAVYHNKAHAGRTPSPKELFHEGTYKSMFYAYLLGFILFILGVLLLSQIVLKLGALLLIVAALLYVYNVMIITVHKPKQQ